MIYKIELSKEELDLIAKALGELPFKVSAPLFAKLQEQCRAQEPAQDQAA